MPRTGASSTIEMSPRARRRYDRKRRREQQTLDAKCKQLAGPVTVTYLPGRDPGLGSDPGPKGAAEECSAERQRAPETHPVAPAEGRAWETPATRTV